MAHTRPKIVVVGGGTGTYTVLSALKKHPVDLTAIVAMSDNGGSSGILRDELGVLPPGDVRTCLVALSTSDRLMRALMTYRFESGTFKGHSFGNLLLSALEKTAGSFDKAVERAADILRIEGQVIPSTLDEVTLMAAVRKRTIRGEENIQKAILNGTLKKLWLEPAGRAHPKALSAIRAADTIVIGPGNLYASIVTNLLVSGIADAIRKSRATKIFVCNLMTKSEHTHGFSVADYTAQVEKYLGGRVDIVVFNNKQPRESILRRYARKGDTLTSWEHLPDGRKLFGADLVAKKYHIPNKVGTPAKESSLVRHDAVKLARIILKAARIR